MPQVPGTDSVDTEQVRDDKSSFDSNDAKDEEEIVEKEAEVQGDCDDEYGRVELKLIKSFCHSIGTDSNENNGTEAEQTVAINDYVESDSLEEDLQKAISTAERRKVLFCRLNIANFSVVAFLTQNATNRNSLPTNS